MSTPRLQVRLSSEEDRTLFELRRAETVPQRTQDRATVLRLNYRGWTTEEIAEYFGWQKATVRQTIHRWQNQGLGGLWDQPREGRPRCWQEEDMAYVETTIQESATTVDSRQLVNQLEQERSVTLSRRHLRRVLKKRAIAGNEHDTAIR
ncbi:helix-turn-helix domain-containing protein [Okeania sp. SIO2G5]|uniref:helix-turn-helix domain-containing protein n=1 Tax=Okeania sp. SIO2G5 TaxID=2607796 RepID=UPI0013BFEAEB|nr:helix-turn-helix domain-containing protein [Okeania sp. SIO2G5]